MCEVLVNQGAFNVGAVSAPPEGLESASPDRLPAETERIVQDFHSRPYPPKTDLSQQVGNADASYFSCLCRGVKVVAGTQSQLQGQARNCVFKEITLSSHVRMGMTTAQVVF